MQQVPENVTAPSDITMVSMSQHSGQFPISNQPLASPNAFPPQPHPDIPPGLEYLFNVNELIVNQQVELLEAFTGYETNNKYVIRNGANQQIFFAAEVNDACSRWCCGPMRPFQMKIMDNTGLEVMHLHRPYRCTSCFFPCCMQKIEVFAPTGTLVGYVKQNWSVCGPSYSIQNAAGETHFKISGPWCTCSCVCCRDVKFDLIDTKTGDEVGKIVKQWSGVVQEGYTDADNFGISFPQHIEVKMKAVILAAVFLIDYMYYESRPKKRKKAATTVEA